MSFLLDYAFQGPRPLEGRTRGRVFLLGSSSTSGGYPLCLIGTPRGLLCSAVQVSVLIPDAGVYRVVNVAFQLQA